MAATSVTSKARSLECKGAWIEYGTFVLDAASIAAAAQGVETATIVGAKVGDAVFLNARSIGANAAIAGAAVTATDTVSIYINNMYDATTAVNLPALTFDWKIVHYS